VLTDTLLTDTHCHLNLQSFDEDRPAVVERAAQAGIGRILIPGIDLETSHSAAALAAQYLPVHAAVGIHPNDADGLPEDWLETLRNLAQHPKTAAIGEIGLDYYWDRTPKALQQRLFIEQLELARQAQLPVVVHCRDKNPPVGPALEDVLSILSDWQMQLKSENHPLAVRPGVLHSFSGDLRSAERAVEHGFLIGITGPLTFKKADLLRDVVASLPGGALLIETDAPFLTPHPHRGKRNEPAYVKLVAEKMAEVRHTEFEKIARLTTANAERLFHWQGTLPHQLTS
jgi:TatD DNase family protein